MKESLKEIESLRSIILLLVIPPKIELKNRWEATVNRIFCSLNLAGNTLTKEQIEAVLINPQKKTDEEQKEVLRYKEVLDFISQNWLASPETVTSKTIISLHNLYRAGKLRSSETSLKSFLNYLQASPEHPVIQAAVALAQTTTLSPFTNANGITSRLLAYLLLYKYGYDFRQLLVFERDWQKQPEVFRNNLQNAIKTQNLTLFLEFFGQSIINQVRESLSQLRFDIPRTRQIASDLNAWKLDERQKAILSCLEQPETNITNRKAQKLFKVSQITASRDLAKLARLGLIFPHGKGRSIYYTKV